MISSSRIELETFKERCKKTIVLLVVGRNKCDLLVGSSKTTYREDTVEANGHGDGKGLLHHLRNDRLASPRSHHLDRGKRDVPEQQGR